MKLRIAVLLAIVPTLLLAQGAVAPRMITPFKTGGGSTIAAGSTISGCTINSVVYIDASGNLACGGAPAATIASTGAFSTGSGLAGTAIGLSVSNGTSTGAIAVFSDGAGAVVTIADGGATTFASQATFSSGAVIASNQNLSFGGFGYAYGVPGLTPDSPTFATATTSESFHLMQVADVGFDFNNGSCGTSACTDPSLIIHSRNQDVDEYIQLSNNGTKGTIRTGNSGQAGADFDINTGTLQRAYFRASTLAVNDNTATTMFTITLGDDTDGGGIVDFCAMATSATTDRQKTCGQIAFSGVDVTSGAGGETCSAAITGTNSTAVSVGTLTVTGSATTGTDLCNIRITSDSSLNVAHTVRYSVRLHPSASTVVITPQ